MRRAERLTASVIVPVYERIDFLLAALRSVTAQTRAPDELIVVVDGPPVALDPVLDSLEYPVRVLHRPRGGPGGARNTGVAAATSTVIAFLDSDDLWSPTKLERQLGALADAPTLDAVFTGVEQFFTPECDRTGTPRGDTHAERAGLLPSTLAIRTAAFRRVGGFPEGVVFGEMLDWYARAVDGGLRMTTVDEVLVYRRIHEHNAGVRFRSDRGTYATMAKALLDRRRASDDPASR
jgi:glycosyltransferase involved in cell wall biosynthesis